jgi:hypothetical protein
MIRAIGILQMVLIASVTVALAQGNTTPSRPRRTPPPTVLGQTGTMYDGNNANLQLPTEANRYWTDLWSAPISMTDTGSVSGNGATGGIR